MRCDSCGRQVEPHEVGRCRTCGLEGLCADCLRQITASGCPDTMRHVCLNYTPYRERGGASGSSEE